MKKVLPVIFIIFFSLCVYTNQAKNSYFKMLKLVSPSEIFIDFNRNFIIDEPPFIIYNIYDISDYDEKISEEKIIVFKYFSNNFVQALVKNSFFQLKSNQLYIKGKNYKELLLKSGFFFDDSIISKANFKNKLDSYNPGDYVILNANQDKYHELSCTNGRDIKNFKIIKREKLDSYHIGAKCCHDIEDTHTNVVEYDNKLTFGKIITYFIDLNSTMKPKNDCSSDVCLALLSEIDNARETIDFAIYGFNNQPKIMKALEKAKKRGVSIRWITNYEDSENAYYPQIAHLKTLFPNYKTNISSAGIKKQGLMHNKFFIFDNKKVFTGSANITTTDLSGFNANYSFLLSSSDIAKIYKSEFEQMFSGKFGSMKQKLNNPQITISDGTKLIILFSPQDKIIDNHILSIVNNAHKYIYIPAFMITDKNLEAALINAHNRGVDIKIICDSTNAKSKYTIYKNLRKCKINVKTENYAGKMHMKTIIVDDIYVVSGSMNFTSSGNKRNDENVIIIENADIAKSMKENFLHLWSKIPDKYLYYDPKAESRESIGSCFDGIDNDFDNKIDDKDEGCFIK